MNLLQKIKSLFVKQKELNHRDCPLYKEIGCTHVDGKYCHYPNCSLFKEWEQEHKKRIK